MRSEQEANRAVELYADTVRRLCMIYLKNYADTEDAFQNVFLKYLLSSADFESEEHEKAWIIRVTVNECKDTLKSFFRRRSEPLEEIKELPSDMPTESREVIEAVMRLPQKYKDVKRVNTVYTQLARAKSVLRERLGDDFE